METATLSELKSLLAFDPDNDRLAQECVTLSLQTRDYAGAAETLRALLGRQPDLLPARFNLGLSYYCLGEFAQAHPYLQSLYQAGDRSPGLLRLLVSTLHHLGQLEEAVLLCDENEAGVAGDGALAGVFALVYLDASRAEAAARWGNEALRGNPDSVDGLVVRGTLSLMRMKLDRASLDFERTLQSAPQAGRAWIGLGTIALLNNDLATARAHIARGLESMPGHVGSWLVLAWTELLAKDLDAAERALRRALELDRNFAETHGGLASVAALRGQRAPAERDIEVALRLDPNCLSAQFARSVLARSAGHPDEAQGIVRQTLMGLSSRNSGVLGRLIERAASQ